MNAWDLSCPTERLAVARERPAHPPPEPPFLWRRTEIKIRYKQSKHLFVAIYAYFYPRCVAGRKMMGVYIVVFIQI